MTRSFLSKRLEHLLSGRLLTLQLQSTGTFGQGFAFLKGLVWRRVLRFFGGGGGVAGVKLVKHLVGACLVLDFLQTDFLEQLVAAVTQHGISFAGSCLPVHEDGSVDAVQSAETDIRARLLIYVSIPLAVVEAPILRRRPAN